MKRWWFAMQIFRVFFQLENSLVSCFCQECLPNDTSASQLSKHIFLSTEAFWSVILNTAFYLIKKNCFSIDSCAQYFPNLLQESIGWNRHHLLLVSTRKSLGCCSCGWIFLWKLRISSTPVFSAGFGTYSGSICNKWSHSWVK